MKMPTALSSALPSKSDSIKGKCFFYLAISKEGSVEVESIKLARKTTLPEEYVNAAKEAIKHLGKFRPGRRYKITARVSKNPGGIL